MKEREHEQKMNARTDKTGRRWSDGWMRMKIRRDGDVDGGEGGMEDGRMEDGWMCGWIGEGEATRKDEDEKQDEKSLMMGTVRERG